MQQKKIKDPKLETNYFGKSRDKITLNLIQKKCQLLVSNYMLN